MKTKIIVTAASLLMSCALTGCVAYTTYQGDLKPVSPKPNWARFFIPSRVDSLHPTFIWEGGDSNHKTDLAIWAAQYKGTGPRYNSGSYTLGVVVYHKDNIAGNQHQIEKDLAPDTIYFWSVKFSGTKQWSVANHGG